MEVQAFEQTGNVMYVGGNFRHVQRDAAGTGRVAQPFLAAFNATTGEHLPRFAPRLNEQVRALKALPNGYLAVGGDFTRVNGRAVRALVVVSPTTGSTLSSWGTRVESRSASGVARVRSLDLSGKQLYLGGTFTHLARSDGSGRVVAGNAGRVGRATGYPTSWSPEFNGTVLDVDVSADGTRAYFSGHFSTYRGAPAFRVAAVLTTAAAPLDRTTWKPVWSTTKKTYQRSILQAGNRVWVGGSEHSLFGFSTSTYQRLSGSIMKRHGDVQVIESRGTQLFAGCHCNDWAYQDAYTWPTLGTAWSQADTIGWFGQWHTGTGRYVPHFTPEFSTHQGSGIWAIKVATDGTVWAGGDVATGRTTSGSRWLGGFGRWAPRDSTAPGAPSDLRAVAQGSETVALAWNASTGGPALYQVLRDDRVVAVTAGPQLSLTVPNGGRNRFFVRAVDTAGNASASTPVLVSSPAG